MSGTYTAAGASIGTAVPGIGTVIGGTIGGIVDVFDSIFGGGTDPGYASGNKWIPGDLQSRFQTVDNMAAQMGIMPNELNQAKVYDILTTPGIWQDNIRVYLQSVLANRGTTQPGPGGYTDNMPPGTGQPYPAPTQKDNTLLYVIGAAAVLLFVMK